VSYLHHAELPDFSWSKHPNWKNIPNDQKLYQTDKKEKIRNG
jgi:hypothetical protein